jgi:hypothetical protein
MSDRYNPSDAELAKWLFDRASVLRAQVATPDREDANRQLGMADQFERCARALQGRLSVHGEWVDVKEWVPVTGEPVVLKLRFPYRNLPDLIHYDVGAWTPRGGGDWDHLRVGQVLKVARLYEDTNGN